MSMDRPIEEIGETFLLPEGTTFHDLTESVARVTETRAPRGWWILFIPSVLLLGFTPFYGAYVLACGLGYIGGGAQSAYFTGFLLPFLLGAVGLRVLYMSFDDLITTLPQTHKRRGNVLRRMVLCWGAVYAAIAPVALWKLTGMLPVGIDALVKALFG